jgi:hypothetical protein
MRRDRPFSKTKSSSRQNRCEYCQLHQADTRFGVDREPNWRVPSHVSRLLVGDISGNHSSVPEKENITKRGPVLWSHYEQRLQELDILFRFVRCAFDNLSETRRKGFVKELKFEEEAEHLKWIQGARAVTNLPMSREDFEKVMRLVEEHQRKDRRAKYRGRTHTQYGEWVVDGMTSAEILFRFTIFEDFLKHTHGAILQADTSILARIGAGNTEKKQKPKTATYVEIFSGPFQEFAETLINEEVNGQDYAGIERRLEYFKNLGIDLTRWRNDLTVISDIRNKIVHGNPLEAITTDDVKHLPLENIQTEVAKILKEVMKFAFEKAQRDYPGKFKS